MENSDVYMAGLEHYADSLRTVRDMCQSDSARWELTYALFKEYIHADIASARELLTDLDRFSVTEELSLRTVVCRMRIMRIDNDTEGIANLIPRLHPSSVSESFRGEYYRQIQRNLDRLFEDEERAYLRMALEDSCLSADVRALFNGEQRYNEGKYDEAVKCFKEELNVTSSMHMRAMASFNIAKCYNELNVRNLYLEWLIKAAECDIQVPATNSSLWRLSSELYQERDYVRASRYMRYALRDAVEGSWEIRAKDITTFLVAVSDEIESYKRARFSAVLSMTLLLSVLLVSVIILYGLANSQKSALKEKNQVISLLNDKLRAEGIIKEEYLFKYMDMSVSYLGKVSDYRHQLRQSLKDGGIDGIKAMLRKPDEVETYNEFYRHFDETFLRIYPDFVTKVNALLKEDARMKEDLPFSTDLRILAVIRLGFKDSGQIARFLNMSPSSIYTKRSVIKHSALNDVEHFEENIRKIV